MLLHPFHKKKLQSLLHLLYSRTFLFPRGSAHQEGGINSMRGYRFGTRRQVLFSTVTFFFAIVFLAGCANPKTASNSNFKRVLQEYHSEGSPCFVVGYQFPLTYEDEIKRTTAQERYSVFPGTRTREARQVEFLVDIGVVEDAPGSDSDENTRIASLTDFGKSIAKPHVDENSERGENGNGTEFCWGSRYRVDEVTSFTEPASAFGVTISMVKYTLAVDDPVEWPDGSQGFFEDMKGRISNPFIGSPVRLSGPPISGEPSSQETELVLLGDGWAHISAME